MKRKVLKMSITFRIHKIKSVLFHWNNYKDCYLRLTYISFREFLFCRFLFIRREPCSRFTRKKNWFPYFENRSISVLNIKLLTVKEPNIHLRGNLTAPYQRWIYWLFIETNYCGFDKLLHEKSRRLYDKALSPAWVFLRGLRAFAEAQTPRDLRPQQPAAQPSSGLPS